MNQLQHIDLYVYVSLYICSLYTEHMSAFVFVFMDPLEHYDDA
jgi:hypothetical protein